METATEATVEKTKIRPNVKDMVKTKSGSFHKDDFVGTTLNGLTVDQVSELAGKFDIDVKKYAHLNPGQVRMTIGNKFRAMTKLVEVAEVDGKPNEKQVDANEKAYAARDKIEDEAASYKQINADAAEAKAKSKASAAAAKAKSAAPVESEGGEV
jgi:hypothetical protein